MCDLVVMFNIITVKSGYMSGTPTQWGGGRYRGEG